MSNWISVDERLPVQRDREVSIDALVYAEGVVYQAAVYFDSADWFDNDGDAIYDVTHWQPLPEPPK